MSLYTGHFSRPSYDKCSYPDQLNESTGPYRYSVDTARQYNCRGCLTSFGPRSGLMGVGVSNLSGNVVAAAQENIDVDSIMSNRNVPISRCKRGKVNPINLLNDVKTIDMSECDDYLDQEHTRMTDPAMFYRGAPINRFFDLNKNPQENIFFDYAVDTKLEAKDNFVPDMPIPLTEWNYPDNRNTDWIPCSIDINANANCGDSCIEKRCERKLRMGSNYKYNTLNERKARGYHS